MLPLVQTQLEPKLFSSDIFFGQLPDNTDCVEGGGSVVDYQELHISNIADLQVYNDTEIIGHYHQFSTTTTTTTLSLYLLACSGSEILFF
jgi:hypothetical protein